MKFTFLIGFILLSAICVRAQDTLVKRNGDTLAIKLTEINPDNIRYKRFDYLDGPVYTVLKEEVKYVIYQNGKKEFFDNYVPKPKIKTSYEMDLSILMSGGHFYYKERRLTEPDMLSVIYKLNDKGLNSMGKNIERLKFGQNVFTVGAVSLFISGLYIYQTNRARQMPARRGRGAPVSTPANTTAQNNARLLMLGALASGIVSVSFMIDRKKHDRIVVDAYNKYIVAH